MDICTAYSLSPYVCVCVYTQRERERGLADSLYSKLNINKCDKIITFNLNCAHTCIIVNMKVYNFTGKTVWWKYQFCQTKLFSNQINLKDNCLLSSFFHNKWHNKLYLVFSFILTCKILFYLSLKNIDIKFLALSSFWKSQQKLKLSLNVRTLSLQLTLLFFFLVIWLRIFEGSFSIFPSFSPGTVPSV